MSEEISEFEEILRHGGSASFMYKDITYSLQPTYDANNLIIKDSYDIWCHPNDTEGSIIYHSASIDALFDGKCFDGQSFREIINLIENPELFT